MLGEPRRVPIDRRWGSVRAGPRWCRRIRVGVEGRPADEVESVEVAGPCSSNAGKARRSSPWRYAVVVDRRSRRSGVAQVAAVLDGLAEKRQVGFVRAETAWPGDPCPTGVGGSTYRWNILAATRRAKAVMGGFQQGGGNVHGTS